MGVDCIGGLGDAMLEGLPQHIAEALECAEDAAQQALHEPELREQYDRLSRKWRLLAHSFEYVLRLEHFLVQSRETGSEDRELSSRGDEAVQDSNPMTVRQSTAAWRAHVRTFQLIESLLSCEGQPAACETDRDWPYQVRIPVPEVKDWDQLLGEMFLWCAQSALTFYTRLERHPFAQDHIRWGFLTAEAARGFQAKFGGDYIGGGAET
jgi:hypothetical protein